MKSNNPFQKTVSSVPHNQSMHKYDSDFYEFRPYFYGIFALACFYFKSHNAILPFSGALFAFSSAAIFYMRYFHRHYR